MSNATSFTKSSTPGTYTAADGSIRITSEKVKRHGKWVTRYTATQHAGTPNWKDIGQAYSLDSLTIILVASGLIS